MVPYPAKAVAAATALALLMPGTATAAVTAPTKVTKVYAASDAIFANPGRGFFTYTETYLSQHEPLSAAELSDARVKESHSLVFRNFYLDEYSGRDTITASDLGLISADLAAARTAGVTLVMRFAYTSASDADAPLSRVLKHIAQLKPILVANADVITALQAGFIGRWGEWYYTQNFTATDWSDRKQVVAALLAAAPASVPIQVRTPAYKRKIFPNDARIGIHNDCFLASDDDFGTYTAPDDRTWLAAQPASALLGGETCQVSTRSGWATASKEMAAYHWTYLNPTFNQDVLDSWGTAGRAVAARKLGYRIRLVRATLPTRSKPSGTVTASLTLLNEGYAPPARNRPVQLVLTSGNRRIVTTVKSDVRTWAPGKPVTLSVTFKAPSQTGAWGLSLILPDPSVKLASTPAYAVQLANPGVWNPTTGRNTLGATLTVAR
ncbi:DUF4832 domain-containing protein [Actinoplanes sp. NBRC 101535]|uniref:DUF4832 domain-containing protein n=1 Tax=Actinoplanes sp. NBRC 101535 TaxID=3032196 RepID=UPI0024A1311A|nr:DUF4832 domain-containing protein [Actinoplanes sp. NBRC 101535]GLY02622.1 hypothetical protein Acsp01_30010 [Actinoplanes sp. NBRC 101535]